MVICLVKTTVDIPDRLLRRAKASAANDGITLKQLLTEALQQRLGSGGEPAVPSWKALAGELRDLREESRRIDRKISAAFEVIDEDEG